MQKDTTEYIQKYREADREIQRVMASMESAKTMAALGEKYELSYEKTSALSFEVGLVLLGMTHPRKFRVNLVRELDIDETTAQQIATEVHERIFNQVKELLQNIHHIREGTLQGTKHITTGNKEKVDFLRAEFKKSDSQKFSDVLRSTLRTEEGTTT